MKLDWKFLITLLAAVAGVAVPVWLWQADQSSKSLSIKLATKISIQPKEQGPISGIEISVNGARLVNPHLVVFEIRNNGSKPIPATDFESPIQVNPGSETKLVRANITETIPKDIDVSLATDSQGITLKPTLLNPGDFVSVTAITSGDSPTFQSKVRIIGVSNVVLEDGTTKKPNKIKLALLLLGSLLSMTGAWLVSDGVVKTNGVFLRRRAAVFVGLVALIPASIGLLMFLDEVEIQGFWYFMLYDVILILSASLIASVLNRNQKEPKNDGVAK